MIISLFIWVNSHIPPAPLKYDLRSFIWVHCPNNLFQFWTLQIQYKLIVVRNCYKAYCLLPRAICILHIGIKWFVWLIKLLLKIESV